MSRGQRIGLLVGAVVIAVAAFVIAKPGSDDSKDKTSSTQAQKPGKPAGPKTFRIALKGHKIASGPKTIKLTKGDRALLVVSSDGKDTVHLHGWNIEREVTPAKPGRFAFKAKNEGAYEIESHTTEQKLATIQVQPE
jgi:hypothetical protein